MLRSIIRDKLMA